MNNKKTKKRVRWDRLALLIGVGILIIGMPIWLISSFLTNKSTEQTQTISTDTKKKVYTTPKKGDDGVYRIDDTIIVNKKYGLPQNYNPGENTEAVKSLKALLLDMQRENLKVSSEYVGYRSYETQNQLYTKYTAEYGQQSAERFSARAGFSEHQTGLAFDIMDQSGELIQSKNDPKSTNWIENNAHQYGFIVRYLEDKESITGYMHEEWHVRYVGKELAFKIYESKQSLEEYFNIEGGSYS